MPIFVIGSDPIPITNGFIRVWSVRFQWQEGNRRGRAYLVVVGEWRIHEGAGREASASKRWSSAARGTAAESAVGDEGASVRA